jgi:four helix bundle protein
LDIVLGTLKLLYFGLGIEVITEGKYSGYLLAHRAVPIRRAASSTPSNIAEGCDREGDAELPRFCIIARSSASELEYELLLARDLRLLHRNDYDNVATDRRNQTHASNSFQSPV